MRWPFRAPHGADDDRVVEAFTRNLDEALRWCRPRFSMYDLERSLRSPELAPTSELFGAEQAAEVVQDVIERRRTLLLTDDKKPDVERCSFWGYQGVEDNVSHHLLVDGGVGGAHRIAVKGPSRVRQLDLDRGLVPTPGVGGGGGVGEERRCGGMALPGTMPGV